MGLDAVVYCDCFETHRLRVQPPGAWNVSIDDDGSRYPANDEAHEDLAFDKWNNTACDHPDGIAVGCYLGNSAGVGLIHRLLARHPDRFARLLDQVVYSGSHCGDHVEVDDLQAMADELTRLDAVRTDDEETQACVRQFQRDFQHLVNVAQTLRKPIAF